jgi:hypothetical protein
MLVIKDNNPKEKGRWSSEQVHVRLKQMLEKCYANPEYCCQPAPYGQLGQHLQDTFVAPDPLVEIQVTNTTDLRASGFCRCRFPE